MKAMMNYMFRNAWWNIRKRPKVKIWLTVFDIIIEIAGFVALLAIWIFLAASYSKLPEVIPVHFNVLGQADEFSEKNSIFRLPVIVTVLFAGMTILSRFPHICNYPVRITENNVIWQYRNMTRMIRCLKFGLVLFFGALILQTIRYAAGDAEGLGSWFMLVSVAFIVIPVIYFMVKSFFYR
jgi:hypothetical protein